MWLNVICKSMTSVLASRSCVGKLYLSVARVIASMSEYKQGLLSTVARNDNWIFAAEIRSADILIRCASFQSRSGSGSALNRLAFVMMLIWAPWISDRWLVAEKPSVNCSRDFPKHVPCFQLVNGCTCHTAHNQTDVPTALGLRLLVILGKGNGPSHVTMHI